MKRFLVTESKPRLTLRDLALTLALALAIFVVSDQMSAPVMTLIFKNPPLVFGEHPNIPGVDALWRMTEANIRPIVFTGSSQMQLGVSPHLFDDQVALLAGTQTVSVNVSFAGSAPLTIRDVLQTIIIPAAPTAVIYGVEMRAFNTHTDEAINNFVRSPLGYAFHLQTGIEKNTLLWLGQHSTFFRWRDDVRELLNGGTVREFWQTTDDRGFTVAAGRERQSNAYSLGFVPFYPNADMRSAFTSILKLCRSVPLRCIIVNMPILEDAYKEITQDTENVYLGMLQDMTKDSQVPIWNLNTPTCRAFLGDESFYNLSHLSPIGANKLTRAIAALYVEQVLAKTIPPGNGEECAKVILP